jgi:outer membrane protein, heavy metal efflux system
MKNQFLVLLSFFFTLEVFALNEFDIIESVNKHFLLIEKELLEVQAAEAKITEAKGEFDTKLSLKNRLWQEADYDNQFFDIGIEKLTPYNGLTLKGGQRQGRGNFPVYEGKYKTSEAGEFYLGLSMPLLRDFQTDSARTMREKAKLGLNLADETLRLKRVYYTYKALLYFYQYQLEHQKFLIIDEIYKISVSRQKWLENKIKAGDTEQIRLVDNNRALLKRENELLKIKMSLLKLKNNLSLFLRDEQGKPVTIPEALPPNTKMLNYIIGKVPKLDFSRIPSLRAINREIDILRADFKLEDQNRLPELGVDLMAMRNLTEEKMHPSQNSMQVGISFSYPLENNKAIGKSQSLNYKIQAYERKREFLKQELSMQYEYRTQSLKLSQKSWELLVDEAMAARKMAEAERRKWQQGASDLFIVTLREQDLADTEVRKWKTYMDTLKYYLDISLLVGEIVY